MKRGILHPIRSIGPSESQDFTRGHIGIGAPTIIVWDGDLFRRQGTCAAPSHLLNHPYQRAIAETATS